MWKHRPWHLNLDCTIFLFSQPFDKCVKVKRGNSGAPPGRMDQLESKSELRRQRAWDWLQYGADTLLDWRHQKWQNRHEQHFSRRAHVRVRSPRRNNYSSGTCFWGGDAVCRGSFKEDFNPAVWNAGDRRYIPIPQFIKNMSPLFPFYVFMELVLKDLFVYVSLFSHECTAPLSFLPLLAVPMCYK